MLCSVKAFQQQCQAFAEGSTVQSLSTTRKQTLQEHTHLTKGRVFLAKLQLPPLETHTQVPSTKKNGGREINKVTQKPFTDKLDFDPAISERQVINPNLLPTWKDEQIYTHLYLRNMSIN